MLEMLKLIILTLIVGSSSSLYSTNKRLSHSLPSMQSCIPYMQSCAHLTSSTSTSASSAKPTIRDAKNKYVRHIATILLISFIGSTSSYANDSNTSINSSSRNANTNSQQIPVVQRTEVSIDDTLAQTERFALDSFDSIVKASVPQNANSAIAIAAAETCAGIIGGFSSRKVAEALKVKKKDVNIIKSATTGVFFGTRSIIRTCSRLIGFPRPLAIIVASIGASIISETTKVIGRRIMVNSSSTDDITSGSSSSSSSSSSGGSNSSEVDASETISLKEVAADISKWVAYDALRETFSTNGGGFVDGFAFFTYGVIASWFSSFIKLSLLLSSASEGDNHNTKANKLSIIFNEALQSGTLFLFYEEFQNTLLTIDKGDGIFEQKFPVDRVLEGIEDSIKGTLSNNR